MMGGEKVDKDFCEICGLQDQQEIPVPAGVSRADKSNYHGLSVSKMPWGSLTGRIDTAGRTEGAPAPSSARAACEKTMELRRSHWALESP
jgi:hypothetical protein